MIIGLLNTVGNFKSVICRNGLSNRLRLLTAYMVVAEKVYNTSHVVMVWEINEAVVGHFLEIFRPLETVTFISANQRPVFENLSVAHFGPSYASFLEIMRRFHLDVQYDWHDLHREKYQLLIPVPHLLNEVHQFVMLHNICQCLGVHVRHTDLDSHPLVRNKNHSSNSPFFEFIESYPSETCVYLMTDNPTTQKLFLQRYGHSRLVVFDTIKEPLSPRVLSNHRFTSLHHTIVDVLITTAHTTTFMGTNASSLSLLVTIFKVTLVHPSDDYASCKRHIIKIPSSR